MELLCIFAALAVLSFRYQKRFEEWLFSKFSKKKGKGKEEESHKETEKAD